MERGWYWLSLVLLLCAGPSLLGGEHAVPLRPDFDTAQCVDCHSDKQEGKHVHTALSLGCTSCHQVDTQPEATVVNLTMPAEELCAVCHEKSQEKAHEPYAQNQCLVCHDAHATEFVAQTRAAANALCLECHLERPAAGATVQLFGTKTMAAEEFATIPKIFLDSSQRFGHPYMSHPVADGPDPLREGETYSCLSCHVPHAATQPRLLRAEWSEIEICDRCHAAVKSARTQP